MRAGRGVAGMAAVVAGAWLASGGVGPLQAQPVGPTELPPSSFDGTQYVDSAGCAFVRAGISGNPMWVPRLSRERERLCGFAPTFPAGASAEPPANPFAGVPNPLDIPLAGLPSSDEAAPVVAEAPAPAPAPVRPRPASPSPRVVAVAPPPPPVAAPVPVEPVRLTRAEACEGLAGLQPQIRDGRTGAPVDCGPAPAALGPATLPAPAAEPLRLTLAEVCADSAATGRRYVYRDSGAPVACAAPVPPLAAPAMPTVRSTALPAPVAAPVAPVAVAYAGACSVGVVGGASAIGAGGRCGPQLESPSGATRAVVAGAVVPGSAGGEVARAAVSPAAAALPRLAPAVPASNPIGLAAVPVAPAAGYERVWDDGRVNLARGVPQPVAGAVVMGSQVVAPGVATIPVPVEAAPPVVPATGVVTPVPAPANVVPAVEAARVVARAPAPQAAIYVQVGAFGEAANAQRAVATLAALGLPVGVAAGQVQAVAAGPFASPAEAQAALARARAAGYGDAFIR